MRYPCTRGFPRIREWPAEEAGGQRKRRGRSDGIRDTGDDCGSAGRAAESAQQKTIGFEPRGFPALRLCMDQATAGKFLRPAKEN